MATANYHEDFYAWTQEQAALLRSGRTASIDVMNLLEEVESMGRSERAQLENRLAVLLAHLLKWQFQPGLRSRSWELTVKEQRRQIARLIKRNPSLTHGLEESLNESYGDAILLAGRETGIETFPESCPFPMRNIMEDGFMPE